MTRHPLGARLSQVIQDVVIVDVSVTNMVVDVVSRVVSRVVSVVVVGTDVVRSIVVGTTVENMTVVKEVAVVLRARSATVRLNCFGKGGPTGKSWLGWSSECPWWSP